MAEEIKVELCLSKSQARYIGDLIEAMLPYSEDDCPPEALEAEKLAKNLQDAADAQGAWTSIQMLSHPKYKS